MANRRSGRPLTPEDQEMWRRVSKTIRRAAPKLNTSPETPESPAPKKAQKPVSGTGRVPGPPAKPPQQRPKDPVSAAQLDGKLDGRLRRGRIEPERTLDLHGLTAARAEAILKLFVGQSRNEGVRLVLVITGKGRVRPGDDDIMPQRKGILRDHLPVWVGDLGDTVVKTVAAHPRHGGAGAFYLYLRRKRAGR